MTRLRGFILGLALACGPLCGQQPVPKEQAPPSEDIPPEEDEGLQPKEYSFNPVQAQKEVRTGNFYFRKGSYKAAAIRFAEATKWNPEFAEAYLRLGDAREKVHDKKAAREAYAKYLELAPGDKRAAEIRKKIGAK